MKIRYALFVLLATATALAAAEYHVSVRGDDGNGGSASQPLRTIQAATRLAQPGDAITVHEGVYRERVNPPRGGESDAKRIVYQAAPGEKVEIKGSEIAKGWVKEQGNVWKLALPNTFFGNFNPYSDKIRGDWFQGKGRDHHTGAVYLNGHWLIEAANLEELRSPAGESTLWFGKVDDETTTIWALFKDVDPNEQLVEINVRQTVFYPDQPGRNFITVRGFTMRHAATPWAPPTAEQIGLIGTHWSKGWVIENNTVSHSVCCGIALGKHGDQFDNTSANTAEGYVKTIERAHAHPIAWTRENIGHHTIRNNHVSHCEQAGIVGSMGCAFSIVTGNTIHDIHVRRLFTGAEMAGIKFHGAIDTLIGDNHIYRTTRGLWLDWMTQGTRVSRNLFHDNLTEDLFVEVNHGPFLVDNNLFLSPTAILDMSQGGAYAHNLIAGKIVSATELNRKTPYHPPHSTDVAGLTNTRGGDNRYYNNIFIGEGAAASRSAKKVEAEKQPTPQTRRIEGYGLWVYDLREMPLQTGGNIYYRGAQPYANEGHPLVAADVDPQAKLVDTVLRLALDEAVQKAKTMLVTTELLGKAKIPAVAYTNPDGSPLTVEVDYFGKKRSPVNPTPGPFENPGSGLLELKLR